MAGEAGGKGGGEVRRKILNKQYMGVAVAAFVTAVWKTGMTAPLVEVLLVP